MRVDGSMCGVMIGEEDDEKRGVIDRDEWSVVDDIVVVG